MTEFKNMTYPLFALLGMIDRGKIAFAAIRRPFIWDEDQVRGLIDSMYRGYPIGQVIIWGAGTRKSAHKVGSHQIKLLETAPRFVVVDGQQRLTSLYCALKGEDLPENRHKVVGKFRSGRKLRQKDLAKNRQNHPKPRIAFRPRDRQFDVTTKPITDNPEYIPDISVIWDDSSQARTTHCFLDRLEDSKKLTKAEKDDMEEAIRRLYKICKYHLSVFELGPRVAKEQVTEIFIRVNSKGDELDRDDEIFAKMSVWWDDCREQLEAFEDYAQTQASGPSPAGPKIKPSAIQMVRVITGLAFRWLRLCDVYEALRGEDSATGQALPQSREQVVARIQAAQKEVLSQTNWHEFLRAIRRAGFRKDNMVCTDNVMVSYLVYLIGRCDYQIDHRALREIIAPWFFMTVLTDRYQRGTWATRSRSISQFSRRRIRRHLREGSSGDRRRYASTTRNVIERARRINSSSGEKRVEQDLRRITKAGTGDEFVKLLNRIIDESLTGLYWAIELPDSLETSSFEHTNNAYHASLILLNARPLLSSQAMGQLMDSSDRGYDMAYEDHSIFSEEYLTRIGLERRASELSANTVYVQWPDNVQIKHSPPGEYFPLLFASLTPQEQKDARYWYALPEGWEKMEYPEFLQKRSILMAGVIRKAFNQLRAGRISD